MKIRDMAPLTESSNIESKKVRNGSSFNESLTTVSRAKTKEELENQIKQIKDIGERIVHTRGYTDVIRYKKAIQEYLKSAVNGTYELDKKDSFWNNNYFKTVKIVNQKLDDLTRDFLSEEKENIDIASKIEDINGLLIDLYM